MFNMAGNMLIFLLIIISQIRGVYAESEDIKEQLNSILTKKHFDNSKVINKKKEIIFKGYKFVLDNAGKFYKDDGNDKKYPLEIFFDERYDNKKEFLIVDRHEPPIAGLHPNPLSTAGAAPTETNDFDDIVSTQRQYGIFSIKSKNPSCYYAYAEKRLSKNPLERLLALERPNNPRPLVFESDNDWEDFKRDLKNVFSAFKGPNSYIVIVGTSTTFFSENPKKGKNEPLFESAPACLARAANPVNSLDVYTFDTPHKELSDLDVHILIPELSDLCESAAVLGNNGQREVYYQDTLDKCLSKSPIKELRELVKPVAGNNNTLKLAMVPDKVIGQFFSKWTAKLNQRDINFSVLIRPDQRKGSLYKPVKDFGEESYLKGRFVIPIND
jgi:hypothetical protein